MKKIIGVAMGVIFLSTMAYTAFAIDAIGIDPNSPSSTITTTTSLSGSGTTSTTDSTTNTTSTVTTNTTNTTNINTTTATPTPAPTTAISPALANLIKIYISLDGGDTTISGAEKVLIKVNHPVHSIYVQLISDSSGSVYDLGPATFDSINDVWVRPWNSINTPDGSYVLYTKAALVSSTDTLDGANKPLKVLVKNEDVVSVNAPSVIDEYLKVKTDKINKNIYEASKELTVLKKQNESTQAASGENVIKTQTFTRPPKPTSGEIDNVINENSQKLKDAIDEGDANKEAAVVAEIVRVAQGTSEQPNPEITKRVEEGVAKLKQAIVDQTHGVVDEATFKVESVKVAEVITKPDGTQTASKLEFRGKALPNSFVTVYIFSLPIVVTVKADSEGNWNYTLDKELDNGKHQVYVGLTDVKGKLVVKSNPLPFVKTASAITVEQALAAPQQAEVAPSFVQNNYFYGIVTAIILILVSIFIFLGIKMSKTTE